jgi:hypothetical protein
MATKSAATMTVGVGVSDVDAVGDEVDREGVGWFDIVVDGSGVERDLEGEGVLVGVSDGVSVPGMLDGRVLGVSAVNLLGVNVGGGETDVAGHTLPELPNDLFNSSSFCKSRLVSSWLHTGTASPYGQSQLFSKYVLAG